MLFPSPDSGEFQWGLVLLPDKQQTRDAVRVPHAEPWLTVWTVKIIPSAPWLLGSKGYIVSREITILGTILNEHVIGTKEKRGRRQT